MRITVVTPSYNQLPYLEETIHSVLNQRYPDLEYIVVDDGGSDGSLELARQYEPRLAKLITGPNAGQTKAINKGFRIATGDIVAWLNSDDVYLPGTLQRVAEEFEKDPHCRWLTGQFVFFGGKNASQNYFPKVNAPTHAGDWYARQPIAQPATFWRRDVLEQFGLLDESFNYCMDYEFFTRIVTAGLKCKTIDFPFAGYRLHPTSKTVAQAKRFNEEDLRVRELHMHKLPPSELRRAKRAMQWQKAAYRYYHAVDLLRNGDKSAAKRHVLETLQQFPTSLLSRPCFGAVRRLVF